MMTYDEAVNYIHSLHRFAARPALERMVTLMDRLGNPQNSLKFVHVAGTNGKGSTTVMLGSVLSQAGYKAGVFTSPFVLRFNERICVGSEMIPDDALTSLVERVMPVVESLREQEGIEILEFQLITAIAFLYFKEQGCDIVCLEVGLGGLYDATNVIPPPLAAVITSISLDHTELLGNTVEEIAAEKAGIIKRGTPVVCYAGQSHEALGVFMAKCAGTGSSLILPNAAAAQINELAVDHVSFCYKGLSVTVPLAGEHQVYNALSVIETAFLLRQKDFLVSDEQIVTGLHAVRFPVRFEVVSRSPLIVIDGAHNPGGAEALAKTLSGVTANPKIAVMGVLRDKAYETVVETVAGGCNAVIAVDVENPRSLPRQTLLETAKRFCDTCFSFEDYHTALGKARELAGENGMVIVCGSLYLASSIRKIMACPTK